MLKALSISAAILFLSMPSAMAQVRFGACAADVKTHCANVQPGQGRINACVKAHFNDLSDACKARLTRTAAVREACASDIKKQCANVRRGGGRLTACLKDSLANLDEGCKAALSAVVSGKGK